MEANKRHDFPANGFLEAATTNRLSASQNVYTYGSLRRILFQVPVLNRTLSKWDHIATKAAWTMTDQATYVTKNQRMCEAVHDSKIEVFVTPLVSAMRSKVRFRMPNNPRQVCAEFDARVNCTGFETAFPWLKIDNIDTNPRSWWLHFFPPGMGDKLFFVGYARPHQGGIPVMAEMLSRYISLLLSGQLELPLDYGALAKRDETDAREYYHLSPDMSTLVDYGAFP